MEVEFYFLHLENDYDKKLFLNNEDKEIEKKKVLIYFKTYRRIPFLLSTC
jgi:hypothetical protein